MEEKTPLIIAGKKIRALRKAAGFSQEEFALHIEIGNASYGRIERGEQNTTILVLAKIALALNSEISELLPTLRELKFKKK